VQLEPFEILDTQSATIINEFTDLVLPGNHGRDLRFVRRGEGAGAIALDGFVMMVNGNGIYPLGTQD
jgi:hypothetical protein